jgi:hypothetical protein
MTDATPHSIPAILRQNLPGIFCRTVMLSRACDSANVVEEIRWHENCFASSRKRGACISGLGNLTLSSGLTV